LRGLRPRRLAGPAAHHRRHRRAPDHRHPWQYRRTGAPPVRAGRGRRVLPRRLWRRVAAGCRTGRRGAGAGRMRRFAALYRELDRSTATGDKRAALVAYFRGAPPADAAWALHLLSGGKISGAGRKIAASGELRAWVGEVSGLPDWLVDDSYSQVGDLAETVTLLLDDPDGPGEDVPLAGWIEQRLLPLANAVPEVRRAAITGAWRSLCFDERLAFNKLLTGSLRVGVSQRLVQQALAERSGVDIARIAQRMLGTWTPDAGSMAHLLDPEERPGDRQQPYPFFLASPLEVDPESLGPVADWLLEWKWDGIRVQLLRRDGEVALWSRGEERLDGRFPEIEQAAIALPDGTVIDGELLAWRAGEAAPLAFTALQTRIQRRKPGPKTLSDTPVRVVAYDLLELDGQDLRALPQLERRARLEQVLATLDDPRIVLSPQVTPASWEHATGLRTQSRERGVE